MHQYNIPVNALFVFFLTLLSFMALSQEMKTQTNTALSVSSKEFFNEYVHLIHDTETLIIDGRTDEMFANGHIENALNIDADMDNLVVELSKHLDVPRIVVYCTTNRRTLDIVYELEKLYKGELIYISDGIKGWRANGYPVIE